MKIGIDYSAAASRHRSGIGNYIFNLVKGLLEIDSGNEYTLFVPSIFSSFGDLKPNFKIRQKFDLTRWLDNLDVFHGPDFKLMAVRSRKKIVTIHDLASHINRDFMSIDFQELTKKKVRESVERSDLIITPSETVKSQLEEFYPETRGRIKAVYHGISDEIKFISDLQHVQRTLEKYQIRTPYLLFVGNIEQRKNITNLLYAFSILAGDKKIEHDLILIGRPGWGFEKIDRVKQGLNLGNRIRLIGWVDDDDLPVLYSAATVFVYPSWYEGFGFPILEAMKCQLPVVASDIPTHREVASDAAVFVPPDNPSVMADAIHWLITDSTKRDSLIRRGTEHVKSFQWKITATEMLRIYSSL